MDHFVEKLLELERTYKEVEEKLSDPQVVGDPNTYKRFAKMRHQLQSTVDVFHDWQNTEKQISEAQEILRTETEKEMREMVEGEVEELKGKHIELTEKLKVLSLIHI